MTLLLVTAGLAATWWPGFRPGPLLRHHPQIYGRLAGISAVLGLTAVTLGLFLSVSVGLLHISFGHQPSAPEHVAPEGAFGGAIAALLLVWIVGRTSLAIAHAHHTKKVARPQHWLGVHTETDDHAIVVLPTQEVAAFGITSRRRRQVVITEGLRCSVDEDTLRLVIEHELAHLRSGDRGALLIASCLDSLAPIVPGVTRTSTALRIALERAADERASGPEPAARRRLAAHLRLSSAASTGCSGHLAGFRADQLIRRPDRAPRNLAGVALGVTVIAVVATAAALHAGEDLSPYFALLAD